MRHKQLAQNFLISLRSRFTLVWYGSNAFYMDLDPNDGILEDIVQGIRMHKPENEAREAKIILSEMKRAVRDAQPNIWRIKVSGRFLKNCDLDVMDAPSIDPDAKFSCREPHLAQMCMRLYSGQFERIGMSPPSMFALAYRTNTVHEVPIQFLQNESLMDGFRIETELS